MKRFLLLLLFVICNTFAQNTLTYNDEKGSPKATLADVTWISEIGKAKLWVVYAKKHGANLLETA